jgi:glycosyltransferase involved in cell wall biosynthesis/uncharacterized membrane protein
VRRDASWSPVVGSLALLSLFVLAMIVARVLYTGSSDHTAIAWNLGLAWIPFVLALFVSRRAKGDLTPGLAATALLWLLFLPNAPYLITDLKYVGASDSVPVLYDVLLLSAAAWTGLLLGLISLLLMHAAGRRYVSATRAWALVVGVLALSSFGIYLGRIQRWNSWDIVSRPGALFEAGRRGTLHPFAHSQPLALTILFTLFLISTYLVVYSFARPRLGGEAESVADPRRRPRLLLLITLAETGGAQTYLALLLPAVAKRFDVTVAAHGEGPLRDAAHASGVRFVPLEHLRRGVNPLRDALGLVELIRLCRRERPEILHANSSKAGVLGRIAGALTGVPIRIFTVHGWAFAAYRSLAGRLYLWCDRIVQPLTTQVICVAGNEREVGIRARTCVPERSVVVHNAVDVCSFQEARHTGEPPRIVSVGRFAYPKDYSTLVAALAALDADYRACLVGEGPGRAAVAAEARRRLAERVELPGMRRDVPGLLAAADILVLSSRSEGLPISILEAMAAGLPVVATNVGGVSELVGDGATGFLVPPGDAKALAAALERLRRDPPLRKRFGAAARRRAERDFDLARFHDAHLRLYRRELELRGLPLPGSVCAPRATDGLEPEPRPGEREKRRLADHEQDEGESTRQQEPGFARPRRSRGLTADSAERASTEEETRKAHEAMR